MSNTASATFATRLPPQVLYPEREDRTKHWTERLSTAAGGIAVTRTSTIRLKYLSRIVRLAERDQKAMAAANDREFAKSCGEGRRAIRIEGLRDAVIGRAFAVIREVAGRELGMRHFDVQLIGGFALLKRIIAEMETGEGKTLSATLPACTAAFTGNPVHIVTVNDYLARRDA